MVYNIIDLSYLELERRITLATKKTSTKDKLLIKDKLATKKTPIKDKLAIKKTLLFSTLLDYKILDTLISSPLGGDDIFDKVLFTK